MSGVSELIRPDIARVSIRPMTMNELDDVVRIDEATTGHSRSMYYRKRIGAIGDDEADVSVVAELDGRIAGFAFTHIYDGEFGHLDPVGVLDWIGVDPKLRRAGIGDVLLEGIVAELVRRNVHELRTQAGWTEHGLVEFFAANQFTLAPNVVLERDVDKPLRDEYSAAVPQLSDLDEDDDIDPDRALEVDFSPTVPPEVVAIRALNEADLDDVVRMDRQVTGLDRTVYYRRMLQEVLQHSGVRVSLIAELEGQVVGAMMARADYGEYGRPEPTAVLDTTVVAPAWTGRHVGRALLGQLLTNLNSLKVDTLRTEVEWDAVDLVAFFAHDGFGHAQRLAFVRQL